MNSRVREQCSAEALEHSRSEYGPGTSSTGVTGAPVRRSEPRRLNAVLLTEVSGNGVREPAVRPALQVILTLNWRRTALERIHTDLSSCEPPVNSGIRLGVCEDSEVQLNERPAAETGITSPWAPVLPWALSVCITHNKQGKSPNTWRKVSVTPPAQQPSPADVLAKGAERTPSSSLCVVGIDPLTALNPGSDRVSESTWQRERGVTTGTAKKLPQCLWRPNSEKRVSAREEGGPARVPTGWRCTEHLREPLIVMGASESRGATRSGLWGLTVEELVQPGRPAS